jgi:VanZ family protein
MSAHRKKLYFALIITVLSVLLLNNELRTDITKVTGLDGLGHILGFICLSWVVHSLIKIPLMTTALTLSFYAALTEIGQYYLGFRNGEFRDFVADVMGIIIFIFLYWLYQICVKKNVFKSTKK